MRYRQFISIISPRGVPKEAEVPTWRNRKLDSTHCFNLIWWSKSIFLSGRCKSLASCRKFCFDELVRESIWRQNIFHFFKILLNKVLQYDYHKRQGDFRPLSEIQNQLDKPERVSCDILPQNLTFKSDQIKSNISCFYKFTLVELIVRYIYMLKIGSGLDHLPEENTCKVKIKEKYLKDDA